MSKVFYSLLILSFCICQKAQAEVKYVYFTATPYGEEVILKWGTDSEVNNQHFVVERSLNGDAWQEVAVVDPIASLPAGGNYTAMDGAPPTGTLMYRIKQIDFDGTPNYSEVLEVLFNVLDENEVQIWPNPVDQSVAITVDVTDNSLNIDDPVFELMSIDGRRLGLGWSGSDNQFSLSLPDTPPGLYILTMTIDQQHIIKKLQIK